MRVNIYAEEMTDRIEIFEKEIDGAKFEACRFYLYLPVTSMMQMSSCPDCLGTGYQRDDYCHTCGGDKVMPQQVQGPFIHRKGDDDSAAVTFWSRGKLRDILKKAIDLLDEYHRAKNNG